MCSGYKRDETEWLQEHKCIRTCSQLELFFHVLLWIAAEQSGESEYKPLIQFIAFCISCVKLILSMQLSDIWLRFFYTPPCPFFKWWTGKQRQCHILGWPQNRYMHDVLQCCRAANAPLHLVLHSSSAMSSVDHRRVQDGSLLPGI